MLVNELVHDLGRQIDPDVKNAILVLALEGLEKIALNIRNDGVCASKVVVVPFAVRLALTEALLTDATISQQVIDELDG